MLPVTDNICALTLDNERAVVVVKFISSLPPAKIRCVNGLVLFVAYTMRFQIIIILSTGNKKKK